MSSDDAAAPEIEIALAGMGVTANTHEMEIVPGTLDFGEVPAGQEAKLILSVGNRGPAALSIDGIKSDSAAYSVSVPEMPITLAARAKVELAVRFTPSKAGETPGAVTLLSNDPKHTTVVIQVTGKGVQP